MAKIFKNNVALVTGGSSGIGRAAAIAFADQGAKVVVTDWAADQGAETVKLLKDSGAEAIFLPCDVSLDAEVQAMIQQAVAIYGRLDLAFNNAGIEGQMAPVHECSEENWDKTIAVNLKGVWLCMKYEIRQMLQQGSGAIVNNSSVAGLMGFAHLPAYVSSKHGIIGLTKSAALECATSGIRINAVCPGVIRTAMIDRVTGGAPEIEQQYIHMEPIGRMGRPEEVAQAVIWLCSDAASFVTGMAMPVDGGWLAG